MYAIVLSYCPFDLFTIHNVSTKGEYYWINEILYHPKHGMRLSLKTHKSVSVDASTVIIN